MLAELVPEGVKKKKGRFWEAESFHRIFPQEGPRILRKVFLEGRP